MIAYINGILADIGLDSITVDVGGVGYSILIYGQVLRSLPEIGSEVKIYTYLDVKEDDMKLYGFMSTRDKDVFTKLLSVSGVGPKGAQAILDQLPVDDLIAAVISGDSKSIAKAKGVGAKTAQKVIIELKDKLDISDSIYGGYDEYVAADNNAISEAAEALVTLGYSNSDALKAIRKIENADEMSAEDLIKRALKNI
jgi:Holliday junction DNA helicase RuvA